MPVWIPIVVAVVMTILSTAIAYVMRPKARKSDAFDSPQYSFFGLTNQYGPGTPNNTIYGQWMKVAPNIISWHKRREHDEMYAYILCEIGMGVIGGVSEIKINGSKLIELYKSRKRSLFDAYITHGESEQKVYRYNRKIVLAWVNTITEETPLGFNRYTIEYTLDNDQEDFQAATPAEPGYFLIYDNDDEDDSGETHEMVMYTGKSGYTLTGCRLFKSHTVALGNGPRLTQEYSVYKHGSDIAKVIPLFESVTTNHTQVNQIVVHTDTDPLSNTGWSEVTTTGKIQRFTVVLSFFEGLYRVSSDGSIDNNLCDVAIRWYPVGGSWSPQYSTTAITRDKSTGSFTDKTGNSKSGSGNYIGLPLVKDRNGKRTYVNYCYCTDSNGDYVYGDDVDLNNKTRWDDIQPRKDWITFTVDNITYQYVIKDVIKTEIEDDGITKKVWKMTFLKPKDDNDSTDGKYYGPIPKTTGGDFKPVSYTIQFDKKTYTNLIVRTITARTFSEYQYTNTCPKDLDDDDTNNSEPFLPYQKYKIAVKKLSIDKEDSSESVNKLRFEEVQEMTNDDLSYPNKALLGLKLLLNENVNGVIDNITCKVAGKLVKNVQDTASSGSIATRANTTAYSLGNRIKPATANGHYYMCVQAGTTGSTIPTFPRDARATVVDGTVVWQEDSCRTSGNYEDIFADMVTSKLYGRGKYLEMSADDYTNFYSSLSSDAAYCDQTITENGKTRKRMSVNFNIDFRKPLIDTLQAISKNVRAYVYWDGKILKNYIDRSGTADAMFGNVNIIPGTFDLQTPSLSDKINRFYAYYLNKKKDYINDSVSRDYEDETFTADMLLFEEITLYGLTDRWRVIKLLMYLLRTSYRLDMVCKFETTLDGLTTGIGRLFYLAHDTQSWGGQSGRIMTVPSSTQITIDRSYTFSADPLITYGILLRKDDGTVVERVIDKTLTTLGSPTQAVYLTATISSVSANSIYILGRNDSGNEYYKVFRCVKTKYKGNSIEIYGLKYDVNIFKGIYSNDPVSAEDGGVITSNENDDDDNNIIDDMNGMPPNVEFVRLYESGYEYGAVEIYIQPPLSAIWSHADVYIQKDTDNTWRFVGRTSGDPLRVSGLEIGQYYTAKAESFSYRNKKNPTPVEGNIILDGIPDALIPGRVEGLRIYNNRGNTGDVFGEDFEIAWNLSSGITGDGKSNNSQGHQTKNNTNESYRYQVEVYFEGFASAVKTKSGAQANLAVAMSEITTDTKFRFSLADNIEATKKMFAETSTYYGIPQSTVSFQVWAINAYGAISQTPAYILCVNQRPDMKDSDGVNTTPEITPIKNGLQIEWQHPYREYDITHFLVKVAQAYSASDPLGSDGVSIFSAATKWQANKYYAVDSLVYPTILNGHVYKVTSAGTSGIAEPNWPIPNAIAAHPSITTSGVTYRHNSIFRVNKVPSIVKITSSDEDVSAAYYSLQINKLDPKKAHIIQVVPYDSFGQGSPSVIATATPNVTQGDDEEHIRKPAPPSGLAAALATPTSRDLRISWTAPSETDIRNAVIEVRYSNRVSATAQPTLTEIANGVLSTGEACKATAIYISTKSDQAFPTNTIFTGSLTGWKYFFRIQFINSSEQSSDWSHGEGDTWVSHSGTISGIMSDDFDYQFKKFTYTGTWTSTDADTVTWGSGTLKFLKSDGSTENYSISGGNTGNMSAGGGWVIWQPSASTSFSYVTSIGANQVAMAYCKPDTNKAFFALFADQKEFMLTRSLVSAGAIIASHMEVSSLSSITANIGTALTGKIKMSDSDDVRIYLDGDANPPVFRITKDGYEADSETDPDNLLFSSAYNYFKIVDSGNASVTFDAFDGVGGNPAPIAAGAVGEQVETVDNYGSSDNLAVIGVALYGSSPNDWLRIMPFELYNNASQYQHFELAYSPSNTSIVCVRRVFNDVAAGTYNPGSITLTVNWYLLAETLS